MSKSLPIVSVAFYSSYVLLVQDLKELVGDVAVMPLSKKNMVKASWVNAQGGTDSLILSDSHLIHEGHQYDEVSKATFAKYKDHLMKADAVGVLVPEVTVQKYTKPVKDRISKEVMVQVLGGVI